MSTLDRLRRKVGSKGLTIRLYTVIQAGGQDMTSGYTGRTDLILKRAQLVFISMGDRSRLRDDQQHDGRQPGVSCEPVHN